MPLPNRLSHVFARMAHSWAGPIAICLVTVFLSWKLTLTHEFTWLNQMDFHDQVMPWLMFQARSWHTGQFPFWDPHHWGGQPLVGQMQPGAVYPFNWILFNLPLDREYLSVTALHWYLVLIRMAGSLFGYLLARDLGCGRLAAVVAGSAYGLAGFVGTTDWPQMLNGAVWGPLILMFLLRMARGKSVFVSAAGAGASLGFSFLSGHHQMPIFFALMSTIVLAVVVYLRRGEFRRMIAATAVFFSLAGLGGAAQLVPAAAYWSHAVRWVGTKEPLTSHDRVPYTVHARYALDPSSVVGIVVPRVYTTSNPYAGFAITSLAAAAVLLLWRRMETRILLAIGLLALLFSMGDWSLIHGLLFAGAPLVEKARTPAMAGCVLTLSLSALAGLGLNALQERSPGRSRFYWSMIARGLMVAAVLLLVGVAANALFIPARAFERGEFAFAGLMALLSAAAIRFRNRLGGATPWVLAGIAIVEFSSVNGYQYISREQGWNKVDELYGSHRDIVRYLKEAPDMNRVGVDRSVVTYNFGDWHGVDQINGYNGVTDNVFPAANGEGIQLLLGQRYWIGKTPLYSSQELVLRSQSGVNLYRDSRAFPRAWTTHRHEIAQSQSEIDERVLLDPLRYQRTSLGLHPVSPMAECDGNDVVKHVSRNDTRVELDVTMACDGQLIVADTYDPDWAVTVDRAPASIDAAYSMLRGVALTKGQHAVVFKYRTRRIVGAGFVSALSLLGAIAFVMFRYDR